jgi:hypothetical protein
MKTKLIKTILISLIAILAGKGIYSLTIETVQKVNYYLDTQAIDRVKSHHLMSPVTVNKVIPVIVEADVRSLLK